MIQANTPRIEQSSAHTPSVGAGPGGDTAPPLPHLDGLLIERVAQHLDYVDLAPAQAALAGARDGLKPVFAAAFERCRALGFSRSLTFAELMTGLDRVDATDRALAAGHFRGRMVAHSLPSMEPEVSWSANSQRLSVACTVRHNRQEVTIVDARAAVAPVSLTTRLPGQVRLTADGLGLVSLLVTDTTPQPAGVAMVVRHLSIGGASSTAYALNEFFMRCSGFGGLSEQGHWVQRDDSTGTWSVGSLRAGLRQHGLRLGGAAAVAPGAPSPRGDRLALLMTNADADGGPLGTTFVDLGGSPPITTEWYADVGDYSWSLDGATVAFFCDNAARVGRLDRGEWASLRPPPGVDSEALQLSPDGRYLAMVGIDRSLVVRPTSDSTDVSIPVVPRGGLLSPACMTWSWSPDSQRLAGIQVTDAPHTNRLQVVEVSSGHRPVDVEVPKGHLHVSWSPGGQWLAVVGTTIRAAHSATTWPPPARIYSAMDGRPPLQLTDRPIVANHVSWSPNGSALAICLKDQGTQVFTFGGPDDEPPA